MTKLAKPADSESIERLEGDEWPEPTMDSYVARTSYALRRKPLGELTNEEIRIGLQQQVGLRFLVPLALSRLTDNPILEARLYEGDLLENLLDVPAEFWTSNPELRYLAAELAERFLSLSRRLPDTWKEECLPLVCEAYARFRGELPSKKWLRKPEGSPKH